MLKWLPQSPQAPCAPLPCSQDLGDHYQPPVTPGLALATRQALAIPHPLRASSLLRDNLAYPDPPASLSGMPAHTRGGGIPNR